MKIILIIINIIFGLTSLAWPFAAFMTAFLFDAPDSEKSGLTTSLATSIISYPAFYIWGLLWSIKLYKKGLSSRAVLVSLLPLVSIIWMIVSIILIEVLCDGSFACKL